MAKTKQKIGARIRSLRKKKVFTLAKMANECGCSPSLLSQIESGIVNPSFSTMEAISAALGVSLAELVYDEENDRENTFCLVRTQERKILTTQGGVRFYLLSRGLDLPFEFVQNEWPPGTSTGEVPYTHKGQECGFVLEGELEVEFYGETYHLKPGDSIALYSNIPHRVSNRGKKTARAIWVNSVPHIFSIK
jgi:transcriptional regulator with XRE-family HTH domain